LKNQKLTIRKIVDYLNNPENEGGFWLPNIQRPFVWSEDQICRLFDSILRQYPISTLLVWKTTSGIRRRKFIDNWRETLKLSHFYVPEDNKKKCLVLDGQQRLQSLFIGLMGSYEGKELYFNILSGEVAAPDDVKYKFAFLSKSTAKFPWVLFKELVKTNKRKREVIAEFENSEDVSEADTEKMEDHLELIDKTFKIEETVTYQELDSIDNPELYSEDDVVEVFIRANSGGTRLGKSDLLFSLLNATWETADNKMEDLLASVNSHGFAFNRDFVLKTCLVVLNQGAKYEVEKFRKSGVREEIESKWDELAEAIQEVADFVRSKTYIQCDKALPSYLVLIPLVYLRFHFPAEWRKATGVDSYLLRCLLAGAFSGQPDTIIDALVREFRHSKRFDLNEAFGVIRSNGRSLELTDSRLFQMGYGSDTIHLLFNLWYRDFNHTPAYDNNLPQVDHIFPQSVLQDIKDINPETGKRTLMRYKKPVRDQLANCMLLTKEENGAGGKSNIMPEAWFAGKPASYLDLHLIPTDKALWKLDRFDDFVDARQDLIREKFKHLLVAAS